MTHDFFAATLGQAQDAFAWLNVQPTSPWPGPARTLRDYEALEAWLEEQPLVQPDARSSARMGALAGFDFDFISPDVLQSVERIFGVAPSGPFSRVIARSYAGHLLDEVSPALCACLATTSGAALEAAVRPAWDDMHDGDLSEDAALEFVQLLAELCATAQAKAQKVFQFFQPM